MLTPYQFASNTPIQAIDLDGLEEYHYTLTFNKKNGVSVLTKTGEKQLASTNLFGVPYPGGQVKRAIVQYDKKTYHIGFGRGDDLTTFDIFRLWKTKPSAKLFESLFPSDEDRIDAELMKFYRQNQDMLVSVLTSAVPLGFINFEPVRPLQNNKPGAKQINKEVQNISEGKGTPRLDENGNHATFEKRPKNTAQQRNWEGAKEYSVDVPGRPNEVRILQKEVGKDSDGNVLFKYGWSDNHYKNINEIKIKPDGK